MSDRAREYAEQFRGLSRDLIATIESCSPEQLQARCDGEQCVVAALAAHVAGVHTLVADWINSAANGQALPEVTMDMVDQMNAAQFARDAAMPREQILTLLRENGEVAYRTVSNLTDEQLDRATPFALVGGDITVEGIVQAILIGDIQSHSQSIKTACANA